MAHPHHFFGATPFPRCNYQLTPNTQYLMRGLNVAKKNILLLEMADLLKLIDKIIRCHMEVKIPSGKIERI